MWQHTRNTRMDCNILYTPNNPHPPTMNAKQSKFMVVNAQALAEPRAPASSA